MIRVLANDGIHNKGKQLLLDAGIEIVTEKIGQEYLQDKIGNYDALIVRSATKVRAETLIKPGKLKLIGRAGVGLDNIDVKFAESIGIKVFNTPGASSKAVASLAMAHILAISRNFHQSARVMSTEGATKFAELKKKFAGGFELEGKKLGIIGFGRIGQVVAVMATGMGMKILPYDALYTPHTLHCLFCDEEIKVNLLVVKLEDLIAKSDIISLHVPFQEGSMIGREEIAKMKDGVILINTARGGLIDEEALLEALNSGKVAAAGLDVFENEPTPMPELLAHPNVSSSPHIGAETNEAQERIGVELAENIINFFK